MDSDHTWRDGDGKTPRHIEALGLNEYNFDDYLGEEPVDHDSYWENDHSFV